MNIFRKIRSFITNRPKAFFVDDNNKMGVKIGVRELKSHNFETDGYEDYGKLLYYLQISNRPSYKCGLIHENGSKYKPVVLANIIHQIDPSIKIVVFKDYKDLPRECSKLEV